MKTAVDAVRAGQRQNRGTGPHEKLIKSGSLCARLWDLQTKTSRWKTSV
ncbi:hypothetical protein [Aneurinibacillus migulanus]|nr:hypothetical protein [Aneurinibacillus migulanus]